MRTIIGVILLCLACGGDDGAQSYDCDDLAKTVTQRHGTCRLAADPDGLFGCPPAIDAYCLPDGLLASCPSGWSTSCRADFTMCTYGGTGCSKINDTTVELDYVQTLNGIDGLGVIRTDNRCEFRPCNPL